MSRFCQWADMQYSPGLILNLYSRHYVNVRYERWTGWAPSRRLTDPPKVSTLLYQHRVTSQVQCKPIHQFAVQGATAESHIQQIDTNTTVT